MTWSVFWKTHVLTPNLMALLSWTAGEKKHHTTRACREKHPPRIPNTHTQPPTRHPSRTGTFSVTWGLERTAKAWKWGFSPGSLEIPALETTIFSGYVCSFFRCFRECKWFKVAMVGRYLFLPLGLMTFRILSLSVVNIQVFFSKTKGEQNLKITMNEKAE